MLFISLFLIKLTHIQLFKKRMNEARRIFFVYKQIPCSFFVCFVCIDIHIPGTRGGGGKSTKIFYLSKSTFTLRTFYLSTSKITSLKIYSSKSKKQWWSVTKYNYFVTVLKYIFQVSVLYWSSFILSNFYFYFTTFQSIISYFLLHYIS